MQPEIQPSGGRTESCPPVVMGELPIAETQDPLLPDGTDSPAADQRLFPSASYLGTGESTVPGGSNGPRRTSLAARMLIAVVRLYRKTLSPLLPECCRFWPTCSAYAIEALQKHGFCKGLVLTAWRLLRCQPFAKGGFDPVPDVFPEKRSKKRKVKDLL